MTKQELKNLIDLEITNKIANKSITPLNVGGNLKKVLDYYENTDVLPEGIVNLYFTAQRVLDVVTPLLGTGQDVSGKENKSEKGQANGYTPLDSNSKVPSANLNIVNNLTTGGTTNILSAEQGKLLKNQIDALNSLLSSDNINLNTIQKIVDAIEVLQTTLGVEVINNLTSGGTTKALSAEMGKQLNLLKQSTSNLSQSILTDQLNNSKYPSTKEVYDFINIKISEINGGGSVSNLQTVTNIGNSTTNNVAIKDILIGEFLDSEGELSNSVVFNPLSTTNNFRISETEIKKLLDNTDDKTEFKVNSANEITLYKLDKNTGEVFTTIDSPNDKTIIYNTDVLNLNHPRPQNSSFTAVSPISVNNNYADQFGNITIPTGNSGSLGLQEVTDNDNTTTNSVLIDAVRIGKILDANSEIKNGLKINTGSNGVFGELVTLIIANDSYFLKSETSSSEKYTNIFKNTLRLNDKNLTNNETKNLDVSSNGFYHVVEDSTGNKNLLLLLPKPASTNVTKTMPLSVNNQFADEFGNITIDTSSGGGGVGTLQTVTNNGNTTTNNIEVKNIQIGDYLDDEGEFRSTVTLQNSFSPTITKITDIEFLQKIDNSQYFKQISLKNASEIGIIEEEKTSPDYIKEYTYFNKKGKLVGRNIDFTEYNISILNPISPYIGTIEYVSPVRVNGVVANVEGNIILENLQKIITSNYTLTSNDDNYSIIINNGITPIIIEVPFTLTDKFQAGFIQQGTGDVTFVANGVTINTPTGLKIKGANYNAYIEKIGTTQVFQLLGNLKV